MEGGVIVSDPDVPRRVLPGFSIPVRLLAMVHERVAPFPLNTLFGLIVIVQLGAISTALFARSAKYEK